MTCPKCGTLLKIRWSYCTSKKEVWTCPKKDCEYKEELEMWQKPKKRSKSNEA